MKKSIYLQAKAQLKEVKDGLKGCNDKPLVRQSLNDTCDTLEREIRANYNLSENMQNRYCDWLQNYCCSLHP